MFDLVHFTPGFSGRLGVKPRMILHAGLSLFHDIDIRLLIKFENDKQS